MVIKIISIGNKLNKWESQAIDSYLKQLSKNLKVDFINLKGQQNPNLSTKEVIEKESKLINNKLSDKDYVIAWDIKGEQISSEGLVN